MRKLPALLGLLACTLLSALPFSAQTIRINTVISKTIEKDRTELLGSPTVTVYSNRPPTKITLGALELVVAAVSDDKQNITIHSRLTEKFPDGKVRRFEDLPPVVVAVGEKAALRAGEFQLEYAPLPPPDFSLNFPGGTLAELLATTQKGEYMTFHLVGEKADLETEVPALSLRHWTGDALAAILNKFLNPRGLTIVPSPASLSGSSRASSVFLLQKISDPDASKPPGAARFRSYQLSDYLLEKQTVEEITQAIQSAWEMNPGRKADDLQLKFHPGTTLLLVSAPQDAIHTVETVLGSLRTKSREALAADEAKRLEIVATEVRRRRAAREAATDGGSSNASVATLEQAFTEADRVDTVAAEVRRRREARLAATNDRFPIAAPPDSAESPAASPAPTAPAKPVLDPALEKKRLETVNAEVERRRAARETVRSKSSSPAASTLPAPAPATPPEPEKK